MMMLIGNSFLTVVGSSGSSSWPMLMMVKDSLGWQEEGEHEEKTDLCDHKEKSQRGVARHKIIIISRMRGGSVVQY